MLVNITINGKKYTEDSSLTILQVARKHGINIPTLCYFTSKESCLEHKPASCRVCIVEVEGRRNLLPSCATQIAEGMVVYTNNKKVREARKTVVELLLSNHPNDCLTCPKNGKCELQNLARDLGIRQIPYEGELSQKNEYREVRGIMKNASKCVLCGRCVAVCKEVQGIEAISATNRGFFTKISNPSKCVTCGQCIQACPTGALVQVDSTHLVEEALNDPKKVVIVNTAPATRVSLGEEFGLPIGTDVTKQMVTSFRELGFDKVFDTNFTADLTIMEEATEFLNRFKSGEHLPLITSCCPGWVKFIETQYADLLHLPSSCKSPMEMFGAVTKSYYAETHGIDPKDIVLVSLMPCLAKKREAGREELQNGGLPNVDIVLTVKEYAEMLKRHGIVLTELEEGEFDTMIGASTGAADIFANTGGVIEAVARTATKWLTGEVKKVEFEAVRGLSGTREATVQIGDVSLKLCVVSGLANARKVLDKIRNHECDYHAIEIMACPGGCVNGGGQPTHIDVEQIDVIRARQASIYSIDSKKELRVSCDNPEIKKIYDEYLGEPNSHKAHELLHTHYFDCDEVHDPEFDLE